MSGLRHAMFFEKCGREVYVSEAHSEIMQFWPQKSSLRSFWMMIALEAHNWWWMLGISARITSKTKPNRPNRWSLETQYPEKCVKFGQRLKFSSINVSRFLSYLMWSKIKKKTFSIYTFIVACWSFLFGQHLNLRIKPTFSCSKV